MRNPAEEAARLIAASRHCVALTGAGISTESGLPDFRSPGTGLWERLDPVAELSVTALRRNPERFYRVFLNLRRPGDVRPNRAHEVLAQLEDRGLLKAVITQNVDGLHRAAGSRRVLEIHGHVRTATCTACRRSLPMADLLEQVKDGIIPPRCAECAGVVRPDVVLFGDPMPACFREAEEESRRSDLMLVVGSSLQVRPAGALPALAGRLVIVNLGETPCDGRARVVFRERAGAALDAIWQALERL